MKRALVLVCLAGSAFAAPSNVTELLGTTKDGRYLVWTGADDFEDPGTTVVQDLLTGRTTAYANLEDPETKGPQKTQYDAWAKTHPLATVVKGRTSPDKKAVADVVPADAAGGGSWAGNAWSSSDTDDWTLVVKRGAAQTVVARCTPASSIDVYWTADGHHTIWVAHHSGHSMRDPGSDELVVGTDGNPGVAIAVDKAKLKAAEQIAPALAKAGFTVLSVSPAKKPREKSVVFAAPGHEEDAKKLAAAVPGGAEVQKLDWQSPNDLVVALGADAVK